MRAGFRPKITGWTKKIVKERLLSNWRGTTVCFTIKKFSQVPKSMKNKRIHNKNKIVPLDMNICGLVEDVTRAGEE